MFAYTVTCEIDDESVAARFVAWLGDGHLDALLAAGAVRAETLRLDGGPPVRIENRYTFPDRAACDAYLRDHAPRLREQGLRAFGDAVRYTRSAGDVVLVRTR